MFWSKQIRIGSHFAVFLAFLCMFIIAGQAAHAAAAPTLVTASISLKTDLNGDTIAAIGDTVEARIEFIASPTFSGVSVSFSAVGGPALGMNVTTLDPIAGRYHAVCPWTVTAGTQVEGSYGVTFTVTNALGSIAPAPVAYWDFDTKPPIRSSIMTANPNPGKKGDTVQFIQRLQAPDDGQSTEASIFLNLSSIGGPAAQAMSSDPFSTTYVLPNNLDGNYSVPVTVYDKAKNTNTYNDFSMNIDTKAPSVVSGSVVNQAGATLPALPGHIIKFTVNLQEYDGDLVTADLSAFGSTLSLTQTSPPGGKTFEGTFTLPQKDGVEGTNYPFTINVTDNAGNTTSTIVYLAAISLDPPVQTTAAVQVLNQDMTPSPNTQLASVGMHLSFSSNISSTLEASVTVDLSAIGGDASTVMTRITSPFVANSPMMYMATYTIPAGTIENVSLYTFQVMARDSGGNTVYRSTTPSIRIDSNPPVVSALSVTSSSGGATIHIGDLVTVDATVTGVETGSVSADLRAIDGTSARRTFTNISGNTWRTSFTVATSATMLDTPIFAIRVTATDDVTNIASMESALLSVDNEPPVYLSSSWSVSPILDGSHPYVRIGDQLTLDLNVSPSIDPLTIKVDLTSIGSTSAVMNQVAVGQYQLVFTVPEGPQNLGATLPISIIDDAGNSAYTSGYTKAANASYSIAMFDQYLPQPSGRLNVAVTRIDPAIDSLGLNVINLNRHLAFGWPVSSTSRDAPGECKVDLSLVGKSSTEAMTWAALPIASYGYFMNAASLGVTIEDPAYTFIATMTDKAGNTIATTTSVSYIVDCIPPVINSLSAEVVGGGIATIGRQILFRANVSLADGNAPTVNLAT
nr:Ig-like domain repeat protein [Candidatus Ozemobacteraceae bacterium]